MIFIVVALAFAFAMHAWLRADERADRAAALAARRRTESRRILQRALAAEAANIHCRLRLAKREMSEEEHFASLPHDPAPITDVDEFLNDLFGGRK